MRMLIRCKYYKKDEMAFISHLDLLRIFIRALRRASIDLEYSKGFHPHPKISFSPALSLGVESVCEYVDIETKNDFDLQELKNRLNEALPKGVGILDAYNCDGMSKIASISNYSEYELTIDNFSNELVSILSKILSQENIIIKKKNKKGKFIETNVRDRILSADIDDNKIRVILLNSNDGAMKPTEFVSIINDFGNEKFDVSNIIKKNIYHFDGKELNIVA